MGAECAAPTGSPGGKLGTKCQVLRAEDNDKLKILRIC